MVHLAVDDWFEEIDRVIYEGVRLEDMEDADLFFFICSPLMSYTKLKLPSSSPGITKCEVSEFRYKASGPRSG